MKHKTVITNCYFETRKGDPTVFTIQKDGAAVVHMDGYLVVPVERFRFAKRSGKLLGMKRGQR